MTHNDMAGIETVEDARQAAKNRAVEDWKGVPERRADFLSFTDTPEYANETLPFLRKLSENAEGMDYYGGLVDVYWNAAHEQVKDNPMSEHDTTDTIDDLRQRIDDDYAADRLTVHEAKEASNCVDRLEELLEDEPTDMVTVRFYPQVWRDDQALTGDPVEYELPREDVVDDDGNLPVDDTEHSDRLAWHEDAPDTAQYWSGPFYVTVSGQ